MRMIFHVLMHYTKFNIELYSFEISNLFRNFLQLVFLTEASVFIDFISFPELLDINS